MKSRTTMESENMAEMIGDNLKRSSKPRSALVILVLLAVLNVSLPVAGLTRIRDISRPLGERNNKLIGHGFVIGLNGTGDGDSLVTMRPLRELLEKLGNPVDLVDLNPKNVAYVMVTADLGRHGVRDGDKIDVNVHSIDKAKSLAGGTLVITELLSLYHADPRRYGWAQGPISIPDSQSPTSGIVIAGGDIETDVFYNFVDRESYPGKAIFTIVLDEDQASWQVSKAVADIINEEALAPGVGQEDDLADAAKLEPTAIALGPKNIEVLIPQKQGGNPSAFIARIMNLPVDLPDPEAVVVINKKTGVIVITGNVEIAPVIVHVNNLSIRIIEPEPIPRPGQPVFSQTEWTKFDTADGGEVKLQQLIDALDKLNVPVQDKINAIYEINRAGALRASIRTES